MIKLKDGSSARWEMMGEITPRLGLIIYDLYLQLVKNGVPDMTITSLIRPKTGDTGVHALGRGCDIRIDFDEKILNRVVNYINTAYIYDFMRREIKSAVVHATSAAGDAGRHIHLQSL